MAFEAKIIADSICNGHRLTTMQLTHPRIVHAEFNTHCAFARNASSSRAIPFKKQVEKVKNDPFIPVYWGKNQKGMQASEQLAGWQKDEAVSLWLKARDRAVSYAEMLAKDICPYCDGKKENTYDVGQECQNCDGMGGFDGTDGGLCLECEGAGNITTPTTYPCDHCHQTGEWLNVHKQIVNRMLEPWSWITVCVTGTEDAWSNYFALRCHVDAQPEIQTQAFMAQKAYYESTPKLLKIGDWHMPYLDEAEIEEMRNWTIVQDFDVHPMVKVSVGRCARTSYLTQEGKRDFNEDVKLHDRLRYHVPLHASPFEHVCQAMGDDNRYAKFTGWKAYRHMIPNEMVRDFKPNHPDIIARGKE